MSMPNDNNGTLDFQPVDITTGTLRINEIFVTINGETTHSGTPTIFIRKYGCNLRCTYCDTFISTATTMSLQDIVNKVEELSKEHGIKDVCITGGEPLTDAREVDLLASYLCDNGYTVYIETNGTLPLKTVDRDYSYIMDIKVPSANVLDGFICDTTRENLKKLKYKDEVKIVFGNLSDVIYAFEVMGDNLKEGYPYFTQPVLLSPLYGTDERVIRGVIDWVLNTQFNWLPKHHIHFQTQLHKVFEVK